VDSAVFEEVQRMGYNEDPPVNVVTDFARQAQQAVVRGRFRLHRDARRAGFADRAKRWLVRRGHRKIDGKYGGRVAQSGRR